MNTNQEACTVIRDEKGEVTGIIVTQLNTRNHVMYKTEKMGVEEMVDALKPKMLGINPKNIETTKKE